MITSKDAFSRRKLIMGAAAAATVPSSASAGIFRDLFPKRTPKVEVPTVQPTLSVKDSFTGYSNAYEFGTSKSDPGKHGHLLDTTDWKITIEGSENDGTYSLDNIRGMPFSSLEERVYRMRCVERWSMVVPYNGFSLSNIISRFVPNGSARYVAFESVVQRNNLPGQKSRFSTIDWPYVEALTMEEAMHPLTLATFGAYGDDQLPGNGMPFKVTVPWKFGFKSPKFITKIRFTEERPIAAWNRISQREYGWYSNVYPDLPHPRWSQSVERRIWSPDNIENIPTLRYNGYEEEVAHMYPKEDKVYR